MFRLRDGIVARVQNLSGPILLIEMNGATVDLVEREHEAALARIAQGLATPEDEASEFGQWLVARGLAAAGLAPDDPVAVATLERIGTPHRWKLGTAFDNAFLVQLRRLHARRKIFYAVFGQTSCLPESALRRIEVIAAHAEPGAHVVLIGDDDLLAIPLCMLGFRVTVCDIDTSLLAFERALAVDFGVAPSLREVNLLEPFPSDIAGTADVVFTDPISHDNCKSVFLGRACNAAKRGAKIMSAVYADAREVLHRVAATLPLSAVERHEHLTSYYYTRFTTLDYQSDLVVFTRTDGEPPVAAERPMPDVNVTLEELPYPQVRLLASQSARLSTRGISAEDIAQAMNAGGFDTKLRETYTEASHRGLIADVEGSVLAMDVEDRGRWFRAIGYPEGSQSNTGRTEAPEQRVEPLESLIRLQPGILHDIYLRDAFSRRG